MTSRIPNETMPPLSIDCRTLDGKHARFELHLSSPTPMRRMILSAKRLLLFWAGALLFLPVPFLHFVMVPLLALAGVISFCCAFRAHRTIIESSKGGCPNCHNLVEIRNRPLRAELNEHCPNCRHGLWLSLD